MGIDCSLVENGSFWREYGLSWGKFIVICKVVMGMLSVMYIYTCVCACIVCTSTHAHNVCALKHLLLFSGVTSRIEEYKAGLCCEGPEEACYSARRRC